MIVEVCFNPVCDITEVVAGLSIDVVESMDTGTVALSSKESFHNALDEIEKVGRRVRDIFDALDSAHVLSEAISNESEGSKE